MSQSLEVADIFRCHGGDWRASRRGHLDRQQLKVMGAIEACRTARLGGHVWQCEDCRHSKTAYNSCRNRHCPKCQGAARADWVAARCAELLPVPYFHVVFTVPPPVAEIAYHNKAEVYAILFKAASQALRVIAADPRHLGAQIGGLAVLHSWGQTMQHHPHVHCIVPGGGLSPNETKWISCREGFFLPVRVLSRLFRRLFLEQLESAYQKGRLRFSGRLEPLSESERFFADCRKFRHKDWVVYAKRPFGGPKQVLAYLGRYTHRVAISNSRLIDMVEDRVKVRWKDYRQNSTQKIMTLTAFEFIRRFLLHVLPSGFHRIRHFGFMANCHRVAKINLCRELLEREEHELVLQRDERRSDVVERIPRERAPNPVCPCCGGQMQRQSVVARFDGKSAKNKGRPP